METLLNPTRTTVRHLVTAGVFAPRDLWAVTLYPVNREPFVALPLALKPVDRMCYQQAEHLGTRYYCTRRPNHAGRCAYVQWWLGGNVRAVWGNKATVEQVAA